jgi:hypothetical protein
VIRSKSVTVCPSFAHADQENRREAYSTIRRYRQTHDEPWVNMTHSIPNVILALNMSHIDSNSTSPSGSTFYKSLLNSYLQYYPNLGTTYAISLPRDKSFRKES